MNRAPNPAYPGHHHFLPYLINRVTSFLNVEFQKVLDGYGLTLTHWRVLAFLAEQDGLSVSALADATVTEQSTLSRALMNLENRGYIRREPSPEDNRSVNIFLVPEGRAVFDLVLMRALTIEAAALEGIPAAELETLRDVLLRIASNLRP
ncbi:MarR family transcriptional regulator [Azoarcus indigens]|uniref:DNA-binding MarR family transcriptional regulator n=1 Tax=Azoarcus indigens TaxID=29545 RepID=A0A4R6ED54_9RHOO|nr:MarR family transcriptional regulator [Azoarcus indigens]NMG67607.1 MarR family transcriptional regulator [Azoarcus indigens]TDN56105.1 DNA-binding MarR family transcriptional regulator [Azoarcus indigens]